METLSPELFWIDSRCYRLPEIDSNNFDFGSQNLQHDKLEDFFFESEDEGDDELEELIETVSQNRYKLQISVPQTFWPKIVGAKGATKKRIEQDTKTVVVIPRPTERGDVTIRGSCKKDIVLAKKQIDAIIVSSRQKLTFTHFISIPMNYGTVPKNFGKFKDEVLKLFGEDRGIEESVFQKPEKLHLTIATLVLTDQQERKSAEKILNEVYDQKVRPLLESASSCLTVEMKGIEYMNDDPAEVDVLYGKINSDSKNDLVQKIADTILEYFTQKKLIRSDKFEHVKLHVTLMNSLFRDEDPEELSVEAPNFNRSKGNQKIRKTFNAINILKKFQDFYFGQIEVKTIELSVRFSTAENGYYKSSSMIKL